MKDAADFILSSPDQSALFTISETDWQTIHQRVAAVISMEPIAATVTETLPNFPELLTVCKLWVSQTFPQLKMEATTVVGLSTIVTTGYQLASDIISSLNPNDPLPEPKKQKLHAIIDPLAQLISNIDREIEEFGKEVVQFCKANKVANFRIAEIKGELGPEWVSIAPETAALESANGLLRGSWSAVSVDLGSLADGGTPMTTPFLIDLGLQSAILGWTSLGKEAASFVSNADALSAQAEAIASIDWKIGQNA